MLAIPPSIRAVLLAAGLLVGCLACGSGRADPGADPGPAASETGDGGQPGATAETTGAGTGAAAATTDEPAAGTDELFPDVIAATAELGPDGTWTVSATLSSPYDSPARYADAWRVVGPDGTVYGVRELAHDHAAEQPFTRSRSGIVIPEEVDVVTVQGRDQVSGWGGATVDVELRRP